VAERAGYNRAPGLTVKRTELAMKAVKDGSKITVTVDLADAAVADELAHRIVQRLCRIQTIAVLLSNAPTDLEYDLPARADAIYEIATLAEGEMQMVTSLFKSMELPTVANAMEAHVNA
jgi:hypothetical protein